MISDYTSKVLHDAHYQDLANEAKGSWLLKQAGRDESMPKRPNAIRRLRPVLLAVVIRVIGVLRVARINPIGALRHE